MVYPHRWNYRHSEALYIHTAWGFGVARFDRQGNNFLGASEVKRATVSGFTSFLFLLIANRSPLAAERYMDKSALVEKIKSLEGLTNDEKADLIGLLRSHKKYGLVWEDKPEEVEEKLRDQLPVLTEVKEQTILSDATDAPNHILIEGDNLEALTALSYTHEGKIDVIYIDPPYNTGNKDFVYNDSFVDSEDSYRHSKWLSFMSKRLKIAKRLLSDKGVIFISIDDNELANLKLLGDEILGESNFVAKFDWRKKTGANDAKDIAVVTESILLFAKSRGITIESKMWRRDEDSINTDRYKYEDEFAKIRGRYYYDTLDRGGLQYSDSMNFGIEAPDGGIIYPNGRDSFLNDGWIWKWSKEKVKWGIENKFLEFTKSKKSKGSTYTIKYKVYQFVDNEGNIREKAGRAYMNLITEPINQVGNSEMKDIFSNKTPFSNPKPIGLLKFLLNTINPNNIKILDFFAGSGTTLHATMQLNAEDGGNRQCILVTNNENKICEEVTYERNKRVINGYTTPKGEQVEGLKHNTLRYYKTELLSRDRSPRNMCALVSADRNRLGPDFKKVLTRTFEELWLVNAQLPLFSLMDFDDEAGEEPDLESGIAKNRQAAEAKGIKLDVKNINVEIPSDIHFQNEIGIIDTGERVKFARSVGEVNRVFIGYCRSLLGSFERAHSTDVLANYLMEMMENLFELYETEAKKVILYHLNKPKFTDVITKALNRYENVLNERQVAARQRGFASYQWEVPEDRIYQEETHKVVPEIKDHALLPFVELNAASNPERQFASFLESHADTIDWWYKNGDSGKQHYAIPYRNAMGMKALFYVDFVVRMKNGQLFLFDTKTEGSDPEAPNKHNALMDYMASKENQSLKLKGGIIVPKSDNWLYSEWKITNTTDTVGWTAFYPGQYKS